MRRWRDGRASLPRVGDPLLDTTRRWLELVDNRPIEDETFTPYDFWLHAQPAMEWVGTNTPLSSAQVLVLAELAQRLGSAADLGPALEQNFGSCPWREQAMRAFSEYLEQQLNRFTAAQEPVAER
jgi:hypothetical protein